MVEQAAISGNLPEFSDYVFVFIRNNLHTIVEAKARGITNSEIAAWISEKGLSATHQLVTFHLRQIEKGATVKSDVAIKRAQVEEFFAKVHHLSAQELGELIEQREKKFHRFDSEVKYMKVLKLAKEKAIVSSQDGIADTKLDAEKPTSWTTKLKRLLGL